MIPASIPESTAWWRQQQKDLAALADEGELGLMSSMITLSHNDNCAEMLSNIRRGPFAAATEEEKLEYLLTRVRKDKTRPNFENYPLEHVLSFQRRVLETKRQFMARGRRTPLGILRDWWDRTEAQKRAALHAHILAWHQPRELHADFQPLASVPRLAAGVEQKQRPRNQIVEPLAEKQEDSVYHYAHIARVSAEMPRPCVAGASYGGFGWEELRIAGLARSVLARLPYLHCCSPAYCLKDRAACRLPKGNADTSAHGEV